jgi:hypothetical protein
LHIFIEILHQGVGLSMHRRTWVSSWPRRGKATIPSPISEDGKPVAAVINIDDLADLQDRAALAAHLADKAAGRNGIGLDELDAALDRIDAETLS